MNKKIIISIICVVSSIFMFNDNVKAYTWDTENKIMNNDLSLSAYDMILNSKSFKTNTKFSEYEDEGKYWYKWCYISTYTNCAMVVTDYPEVVTFNFEYANKDNTRAFPIYVKYDENKPAYLYYNYSTSYNNSYVWAYENGTKITSSKTKSLITSDTYFAPSFSLHILTTTGPTAQAISSNAPSIKLSGDVSIYYSLDDLLIKPGDTIFSFNEDGTLAALAQDPTPTINITKHKENIINKELSSLIYNINFSEFDITKYNYYYSFDAEEWEEIDKNDYKLNIYSDLTFYIKITDLEDNYITSATYTVVEFDNKTPYLIIKLDENSINKCTYNINDNTYQTCSNLHIDTHITDKNAYSLQIIDPSNNLGWFTTKSVVPSGVYPIFQNGTYQFRIIDNNTKEVIDTQSFVVSSINEEYEELGKYITNECWWDGEESDVSCKYNLYNYDETESTYAYYYSEDNGDTYKKIIKDDLSQIRYVSGVRIYNQHYQKNTYVRFKITTLENSNDIIDEFSFYINYDEYYQENSDDPLVYWTYRIKKKINEKFPIINQFNEIYNSIHYTPTKDEPPEFTIDLSKLGNNKKVKIIDFNTYAEYREEIFFWMKLSIGFITLFKAIKIIRHDYFGGGN